MDNFKRIDADGYFYVDTTIRSFIDSPAFEGLFNKELDKLLSTFTICSRFPKIIRSPEIIYYQSLILTEKYEEPENLYALMQYDFKDDIAIFKEYYDHEGLARIAWVKECDCLVLLASSISSSIEEIAFRRRVEKHLENKS